MLPCVSATNPCGPELGVFSVNSLNTPVFGSSRPSLLAPCPVYQSEPSGPRAGSCGRDLAVGTSYSFIFTARTATEAEPARVVARISQQSLRRDIGNLLGGYCIPSTPTSLFATYSRRRGSSTLGSRLTVPLICD